MERETKKRKKATTGTTETGPPLNLNRVVYSETVRINLADYEHRDFFCSVSLNQEDNETLDDTYKRAKKFVTKRLYQRERKARVSAKDAVDFDTMDRMIG